MKATSATAGTTMTHKETDTVPPSATTQAEAAIYSTGQNQSHYFAVKAIVHALLAIAAAIQERP